jgi:hypothetical protein
MHTSKSLVQTKYNLQPTPAPKPQRSNCHHLALLLTMAEPQFKICLGDKLLQLKSRKTLNVDCSKMKQKITTVLITFTPHLKLMAFSFALFYIWYLFYGTQERNLKNKLNRLSMHKTF